MPSRAKWDEERTEKCLSRQKHVLHQLETQLWSQKAAWDREHDPADLWVCKDVHSLATGLNAKSKELVTLTTTSHTPMAPHHFSLDREVFVGVPFLFTFIFLFLSKM